MWFSAHAYAMHPKMTPAATETKGGARRVQKTRTADLQPFDYLRVERRGFVRFISFAAARRSLLSARSSSDTLRKVWL